MSTGDHTELARQTVALAHRAAVAVRATDREQLATVRPAGAPALLGGQVGVPHLQG
jgi:hypothetical protein